MGQIAKEYKVVGRFDLRSSELWVYDDRKSGLRKSERQKACFDLIGGLFSLIPVILGNGREEFEEKSRFCNTYESLEFRYTSLCGDLIR